MEVKVSRADFRADFKKKKHKFLSGAEKTKAPIPNRFYYVTPPDLIKESELPSYAGLIYSKNGHAVIVKRAPFIHKKKYDFSRKLVHKFYHKWDSLTRELMIVKNDNQILRKELKKYDDMPILYKTSFGEQISDATIKKRYALSRAEKYLFGQSAICEGCGEQAVCSAHIIAQTRLKHLHKAELIYDPQAYFPACYACNLAIENPKGEAWKKLLNKEICLEFIEKHDQELFLKFTA